MTQNEAQIQQEVEEGEIIDDSTETMTLYEVDVMNLVKTMDLQSR